MRVEAFFHDPTSTLTYLVWDPDTRDAVVIDPVLDFDPRRVAVGDDALDALLRFVKAHDLRVHLALDTHAHADHLSGFQRLRDEAGAQIAISSRITEVQEVFKGLFGWDETFPTDGSQWDVLIEDGVPLEAGSLTVEPIATPGHTPACTTFAIGDALFTGDTLFMPDFGTGRCDFPGGDAGELFDSIQRLYRFADDTRVFVGHDYQPGGRALRYETTIGESRRSNIQLRHDTSRESFVAWRTARDATLAPPALLFQSLQVNTHAGRLPEPAPNGTRYLTLPMNLFGPGAPRPKDPAASGSAEPIGAAERPEGWLQAHGGRPTASG